MEIRKNNVLLVSAGTGTGAKLSLSMPFLRDVLGVTEEDRGLKVIYDDECQRIIIIKDTDNQPKLTPVEQVGELSLVEMRNLENTKHYVNELMVTDYGVDCGKKEFIEKFSNYLINRSQIEGIYTAENSSDIIMRYVKYPNISYLGTDSAVGEVALYLNEMQELEKDSSKDSNYYLEKLYYKCLDLNVVYDRLIREVKGNGFVKIDDKEINIPIDNKDYYLKDILKTIYYKVLYSDFTDLTFRAFKDKYLNPNDISFLELKEFKKDIHNLRNDKDTLYKLPNAESNLVYTLDNVFSSNEKNLISSYLSDIVDEEIENIFNSKER